ncbi:uncharacterized protein TNCT_58101 [Trichonephila clavata]|uniref:Uncharacterized protein n=1 Tax=Trichonephila clavata TaxID=2740835 RepID=A0A8X6FNU9_TRICU|nr:uncharacterized protein TNCT_58101 [Trichonephila clavata]
MQNSIAQIFCFFLVLLFITITKSYRVEQSENASFIENWNNDYEEWIEQNATQTQPIYDLGDGNLTLWKESTEDEVMYDIYARQQNEILEIDEEGLELTDNWLVLDQDEEWQPDEDETVIVNEEINGSVLNDEQEAEELDCDKIPKQMKRKKKITDKKQQNDDEFYFKHKKYGKKAHKEGKKQKRKRSWKKNCCIRGKRVGNTRRTFLSENLFQECQERTRSLASRMSRPCRWIFWSCCEARALRRYYIHHKHGKENNVC